jgi:hypothetical protein
VPLVTRAKNPVLNGCAAVIVGILVLGAILAALFWAADWARPVAVNQDDADQPAPMHRKGAQSSINP